MLEARAVFWLSLVGAFGLALWWFGAHERGVERNLMLAEAAREKAILVAQYNRQETDWRTKLATLQAGSDALQKRVDDAYQRSPTYDVRVCAHGGRVLAAAVPETGPGPAKVSGTPAAPGLLHSAPEPATTGSGVPVNIYPGLLADAKQCADIAVRLDWWIDRYNATEGTHP